MSALAALSSPPAAVAGATEKESASKAGLRWLWRNPVTEAGSLTAEIGSENRA